MLTYVWCESEQMISMELPVALIHRDDRKLVFQGKERLGKNQYLAYFPKLGT
jgi:hypothetical protein